VVSIATDGGVAEVVCMDGERLAARHLLANVAPALLARLLGEPAPAETPEGSQLKLNMLLKRLPRPAESTLSPEHAFAGTFHVNEGYEQLQLAYEQAAAGHIPELPPCEFYCHSLTDSSILSPDLRAAGAHTLTLFGLHMPARLFGGNAGATETGQTAVTANDGVGAAKQAAGAGKQAASAAKQAAVAATLHSVSSVLAEPIEDCLWLDADGAPCLEAVTPPELDAELGMPGGHIFHRNLSWPFAESEEEVGRWGVETTHANVWVCGAGARRGGCVSGIPGHNAARAVLAAEGRRASRRF
jgi:phytoene dehydrogenase-like protein